LGYLITKVSLKWVTIVSLALLASGGFASVFADNASLFTAFRLFESVGYCGVAGLAGTVAISRWFSSDKRALPMGIWNGMIGIAGIFVTQAANMTMPRFGWQGLWIFIACFALVVMLLFIVFGKDRPDIMDETEERFAVVNKGASFKAALGMPSFWVAAVMLVIFGIASKGIFSFSSMIYEDLAGADLITANNISSLLSATTIISPIIGSFIFQKAGYRFRGITLVVLFAAGFVTEWLMFSGINSIPTAWFFTILFGLVNLASNTGIYLLVADHSPTPALASAGLTVMLFGKYLGGFLGSTVIGFFQDLLGGWAALQSLVVVLAVVGILFSLIMWRLDAKWYKNRVEVEKSFQK
jgi:predicted MFS family arabinose efflux permease